MVGSLIEAGAALGALNLNGQNCLSEAISRGNREVISVILESDRWREALRYEKLTAGAVVETPIKQLIKRFPDLAKLAFDKCISTNLHSRKFKTRNSKTVAADSPELEVENISFHFISSAPDLLAD